MSLLLAAIDAHKAVIVSDGALTAIMPDCSRPRLRADYRKFRMIGNRFVVGGTGSSYAFSERMYVETEHYLSVTPRASFNDLTTFLANHLPQWYAEDVRCIEDANPGALARAGLEHGASMMLAGYDATVRRARLVVFGSANAFAAEENTYFLAFGCGVPEAQRIIEGWDWPTWPDFPAALADVVRAVAATHEQVGGKIFAASISRDRIDLAEMDEKPVAVSALGGNQWRLTRPNWDQPPGRVVFQATLVGRTTAYEGVTVTPQMSQPNANGTVSIDTNGSWGAVADGPPNALSFRWSSSTSSLPADATVTSSGTLVTGTGRLLSISGGPLTFGQTVYITIIPFSATSGGGTALPAIHLRGSYQSYTATKTANYGIGSFVELNDVRGGAPAHGFTISGSLNPNGDGTFDPEQVFYSVVILPDRATITDVYADVYSANNGSGGGTAQAHNTQIRFDRISSTGGITNLGAQAQADNGGWQAGHMGMSELTTGRRYNFYFVTSQGSSPSTPSNSRIADFSIVYTTPDPSVGL